MANPQRDICFVQRRAAFLLPAFDRLEHLQFGWFALLTAGKLTGGKMNSGCDFRIIGSHSEKEVHDAANDLFPLLDGFLKDLPCIFVGWTGMNCEHSTER